MNDLYKALGDISSIRRQMASTTEFRGYGPLTLAATGVFAILAAALQASWLPDPAHHIAAYLAIWVTTAVFSAALTGAQMYARTRRMHSGISNEMLRMAVEQFLPSVAAGLLITIVLLRYVPLAAVDASGIVAGRLQSRGIFIVPVPAAPDDRGGRMVSAHRAELSRDWRQPRALAMDHGDFLRSRSASRRRHSVAQSLGGRG